MTEAITEKSPERSRFQKNLQNAILFEKRNPDKDIVVLHDGSFMIVDPDKLLSNPEGYDFSYDNHEGNVKACKNHGRAFQSQGEEVVILTQEINKIKYCQTVSKEIFNTPISERIRAVRWE
ncbi:hypothetical protein N2E09_00375 [Leuconostoc citreum]